MLKNREERVTKTLLWSDIWFLREREAFRHRLNVTFIISPEACWPFQSNTRSSLWTYAGWTHKVSWGKRLGHLLFLTRQCCGWLISTQSHSHLLIWGAGDVEFLEALDKLRKHNKQHRLQKKVSVAGVVDFVLLNTKAKWLFIHHWQHLSQGH